MRKNHYLLLTLITLCIFSTSAKGQKIEYIKVPELEKILNKPDNKLYVLNFWDTWCAPCVNRFLSQAPKQLVALLNGAEAKKIYL